MPKGGRRKGAGRKPGVKNKATIEREIVAALQIDAARRGDKKLAVSELEKAIEIAETATGLDQPRHGIDAKGKRTVQGGDWRLFGEWFDRWVSA